jgi:hypothetical protein
LTDINDIYFSYLLNKKQKSLNIKPGDAFKTFLQDKINNDFLSAFNADDWSYSVHTKGKGLSLEGLRVAEMMAYQVDKNTKKDQIETKLKTAVSKLLAQVFEDENVWFIISKNFNEVSSTELNL